MKRADSYNINRTGDDAEMMSDKTLKRLIAFLKAEGWDGDKIVKLLNYIAEK